MAKKRITNKFCYIKYVVNAVIIVCVYVFLFGLCKLDVSKSVGAVNDMEEQLCVISGFPQTELFLDNTATMMKWMLAVSVVFILVGKEIYDTQSNLKYIAMIRYGTYRRFYRMLMNKTVFSTFLYSGLGVIAICVLYVIDGNVQVSKMVLFHVGIIYIIQMIFLCLLQTLCMIVTQGYATSVILLVCWFMMAMCGHLLLPEQWVCLPGNWGMYVRSVGWISSGVPKIMYYIEAGGCLVLWLGIPFLKKRK